MTEKDLIAKKMRPGIYLSPAHCSTNEECLAEWIVFELEKSTVDMINDVRRKLKFLEMKYGAWGSVNCHWAPHRIVVLKGITDDEGELTLFPGVRDIDLPAGGEPIYIGESWDWQSPSDDQVWRSECAGFKVYSSSLYVTALGKHTTDEVESSDIQQILFPEKAVEIHEGKQGATVANAEAFQKS